MTPEQFIENFGAIADSPDGIRKLRELVLSLALGGQLRTSSPNDEPVENLLARIEEIREPSSGRRTMGVAAGDSHAMTALPGWAVVKMGDVVQQRLGKMLDKQKNVGKLRPYLRNLNVQWFRFALTEVGEMRIEDSEVDELEVRNGDLMVCEGGEPGRGAIWAGGDTQMFFQKAIHRVRPLGGVQPEFLLLRLRLDTWNGSLSSLFTGATIKHLTGRSLSTYSFPLPPVAEQKRIVAKVDHLMSMLDDLEQRQEKKRTAAIHVSKVSLDSLVNAEDPDQLARAWERVSKNFGVVAAADGGLERLRALVRSLGVRGHLGTRDLLDEPASILLSRIEVVKQALAARRRGGQSVDKPLLLENQQPELPSSWAWSTLGAVLSECTNGFSGAPNDSGAGVPLLRISAATGRADGLVCVSDHRHTDAPAEKYSHFLVEPGELLACRFNGNLRYVGAVAMVPSDFKGKLVYPDKLIRLRPIEMDRAYLREAINSDIARRRIDSVAATTAGNIGINGGQLRSICIPVPPLAEQRRIASAIVRVVGMLDELERCSTRLNGAASDLAIAASAMSQPLAPTL